MGFFPGTDAALMTRMRRATALMVLLSCGAAVGCDVTIQREGSDSAAEETDGMAEDTDGDDDDDDDRGDDDDDGIEPDDGNDHDDDDDDDDGDPPGDDDDDDDPPGDDDDDDDNMPPPSGMMSFFATSVGNNSGNFGGLAGADAFCDSLAAAVGSDGQWRAYLSTAPIEGVGGDLVHARDRIGAGPWYNAYGDLVAADVDQLHTDGLDPALVFDETGNTIPSAEHDIVTGSTAEGFAFTEFPDNPSAPPPTCFNWTAGDANAWVWVGHVDADPGDSWNSVHATSCDPAGLASTAGSGRIYCFAE